MRLSQLLVAAVAGGGSLPSVRAWGAAGHEIVATIAQIHLHPTVLPKLCQILNWTSTDPTEPQCHLAPIAAWADRNRWKMPWSGPLHYVEGKEDYPSERCEFPGEAGWVNGPGQNLLAGIRNVTDILEEWEPKPGGEPEEIGSLPNEALKFLVHFLGDLHQPLHMAGRARGGNDVKVLFDGRHTSLHGLWDGFLIAQGLRTLPRNYTSPLPYPEIEFNLRGTIYDAYIRRVMWEGILSQWREELPSWVACPSLDNTSSGGRMLQTVMDFFRTKDVAHETDDDILCPYAWAKPIEEMNCEFVWPKALDEPPFNTASVSESLEGHSHHLSPEAEVEQFDSNGSYRGGSRGGDHNLLELDTPWYSGKIRREMIVEKLLAKGGIRLAGILNSLFADLDPEEHDAGGFFFEVN